MAKVVIIVLCLFYRYLKQLHFLGKIWAMNYRSTMLKIHNYQAWQRKKKYMVKQYQTVLKPTFKAFLELHFPFQKTCMLELHTKLREKEHLTFQWEITWHTISHKIHL